MKTKIEIKHRFTGDVLFSFECESIKECVIEAVKTGANLTRANLDMSAFPLRCSSLKIKTNKRLRVQLCFHFLSLIKHGIEVTDEEKKIFEDLKTYANQFHRTDVERL